MSGYFGIWQLLFSQKKPFFSLSVSEDKTLGEEMGKREFFFCVSERWGSGGCSSVNVCTVTTVWKSLEKKKKKKICIITALKKSSVIKKIVQFVP